MKGNKILAGVFAGLMGVAGITSLNAQDKASHKVVLEVKGYRGIFVDEDDNITGIQNLSNGNNFPEGDIKVYRNGIEGMMTSKIKSQYYDLLNSETARKAGLDWNKKGAWYQPVNPSVFQSSGLEEIAESYSAEGMKFTTDFSEGKEITTIVEE